MYIEDIHFMNAVPLKTRGYVLLRTINQTESNVSKNFFSPPSSSLVNVGIISENERHTGEQTVSTGKPKQKEILSLTPSFSQFLPLQEEKKKD